MGGVPRYFSKVPGSGVDLTLLTMVGISAPKYIQSAPAELPKLFFQARVGKELPKQFPEPLSAGKLDVSSFAFSDAADILQARNNLEYFQGGSKSVIYSLINS